MIWHFPNVKIIIYFSITKLNGFISTIFLIFSLRTNDFQAIFTVWTCNLDIIIIIINTIKIIIILKIIKIIKALGQQELVPGFRLVIRALTHNASFPFPTRRSTYEQETRVWFCYFLILIWGERRRSSWSLGAGILIIQNEFHNYDQLLTFTLFLMIQCAVVRLCKQKKTLTFFNWKQLSRQ